MPSASQFVLLSNEWSSSLRKQRFTVDYSASSLRMEKALILLKMYRKMPFRIWAIFSPKPHSLIFSAQKRKQHDPLCHHKVIYSQFLHFFGKLLLHNRTFLRALNRVTGLRRSMYQSGFFMDHSRFY